MLKLTPNRRLAAALCDHYQQAQLSSATTCFATPAILPLHTWVIACWQDYATRLFEDTPHLLSTTQESLLWEQIIQADKAQASLLRVNETASLAQSAYALLKQWQVTHEHPYFAMTEDYQALARWIAAFEMRLTAANWECSSNLLTRLTLLIKQQHLQPPPALTLVGFTEITPQLKTFLTTCEQAGTTIHYEEPVDKQQIARKITLADQETEILTMARFAKTIWQKNPTATVACILPGLDKIRDRVFQIFSTVFAEQHPFNISAGKPLSQYPIIESALRLLQLSKKNIFLTDFTTLLNSPFLGEAETERVRRSCYDRLLRQHNQHRLQLTQLLSLNHALSMSTHCPRLAARLINFLNLLKSQPNERLPFQQWVLIINDLLIQLGWPGERSLSSEEYQLVDAWLALLNTLKTVDLLAVNTQGYTFAQVMQILLHLAAKTHFQPKTPTTPIQILGVLEAAGLQFDYAWLAGMDDRAWPPRPEPHPFIPKRLQRELHMPHATAERELHFCTTLLAQFKANTKQLIFSYASQQDDLLLEASLLIQDALEIDAEALALLPYQSPYQQIYQAKQLEKLADDQGPPKQADEIIKGGMNVIRLQALCPFSAFAKCRLHAEELERSLPGMRAKERGILIHKLLELVWQQLQSHTQLAALFIENQTALHTLIDECIAAALQAMPLQTVESQYLILEKQRLHKLMWSWLLLEKDRAPFKVLMHEKTIEMQLKTLSLTFRIDRVDELANGKKLIIDYKTGTRNETNAWFGERPHEPQLPLYALLDPKQTEGIAFAQVATGELCFKGVSATSVDLKGIKPVTDWPQHLENWQMQLEKLSDEFVNGTATVNPKYAHETCARCGLQSVCRIQEEMSL